MGPLHLDANKQAGAGGLILPGCVSCAGTGCGVLL